MRKKSKYYFMLKRLIDVGFSFSLLIILLPFFGLVALLIKLFSPKGKVFYGHTRLGKGGKTFVCWKFRTMVPNADAILETYLKDNPLASEEYEQFYKLKNDPRVIPFIGTFLRRSSFDELPQFFNVLVGQMSVVGPRPIVQKEVAKYGHYFDKMVSVKPGITGLWQISGRNDISYDTRVALDMDYVDNLSFRRDMAIGIKTIKIILLGKGY